MKIVDYGIITTVFIPSYGGAAFDFHFISKAENL